VVPGLEKNPICNQTVKKRRNSRQGGPDPTSALKKHKKKKKKKRKKKIRKARTLLISMRKRGEEIKELRKQ